MMGFPVHDDIHAVGIDIVYRTVQYDGAVSCDGSGGGSGSYE